MCLYLGGGQDSPPSSKRRKALTHALQNGRIHSQAAKNQWVDCMQPPSQKLYSTGIEDDQTKKVSWVGYIAHMEETRNA
jgi:cytochrome b involved in lipid metabolism